MQTVAGWPTDLTVATPTAKVLVGGVARSAESVSISRELGGSLPAQVVGGSGITGADGSVSWAEGDNVQVQPVVPWIRRGAWPPSPGLSCEVSVGYGDALAKQLTGLTTDTSGSFGSTDLSTGFEDRIAKLNRVLSFDPLLAAMPSLGDGGTSRYIGLNSSYITDRVLRECGFYTLPPMMSGAVVSAPMNGSTWPEWGTISYSLSTVAGSAFPLWVNAPWGLAVEGVDARYIPALPAGENGFLTKPFEMTIMLPTDTGAVNYYAYWGSNSYRLAVTASSIYGQKLEGGTTNVATLIRATGTRTVTLRITPSGANAQLELRTNTGAIASGTTVALTGSTTTPITEVRPVGAGAFAGVQAGFPSTAFAAVSHVPSAVITVNASSGRRNVLVGMPAIVSRTGLNLLKEQEAAECAAMWIDAHGIFRWIDRETLVQNPPVALLTSRDNLLEASWTDSAAHVRSRVTVEWREALASRSAWHSVTVYVGQSDTLKPGEVRVNLIHPGADEDWIMVDRNLREFGYSAADTDLNMGYGTWGGGSYVGPDDLSIWAHPYISETVEKIDGHSYKLTHTIAASTPSQQDVSLSSIPASQTSYVWSKWRDHPLPIIRAKARINWQDRKTVGTPSGPADAEVLTHDAGWWVQDEGYAQRLADYLAVQTSVPAPIIEGLEIVPDPRIELADVIAIDDRDRSGMYLTGLVSSISLSVAEANMSMSIKLRVITADTASGVTYADFTASRPAGETYDQFETSQGTKTYGQFQAAPLAI